MFDQATAASERTAVYRFFRKDGELLYIGITSNGFARFRSHAATKEWWGEVDTVQVEHFATRDEAEEAERDAIAFEDPIHNIVGRRPAPTTRAGLRQAYATRDFSDRLDAMTAEVLALMADLDAIDGLTCDGTEKCWAAIDALRAAATIERAADTKAPVAA